MQIKKIDNIPKSLTTIKSVPKELYFQGNLELLKKPTIAIIGTRRPSQYSRNITYSLANRLANNGFVIISGGAMGTDILAHKGAMPNTISVMANSLDIIYPKINENIIKEMSEKSLLISEYSENITAHPKRFIHRNRLIIGLADIVIVIEADSQSGSSQSMRIAKEMQKSIFVLPHRIGESTETNLYLENGEAQAIFDIDVFLENMKTLFGIAEKRKQNIETDSILEFCKNSPTYEDAFGKFGDKLFEYELDGKIEIHNGCVVVIS